MTSVPSQIPRSRLRMIEYHIVVASPLPWIRSQGRGGRSEPSVTPSAMSLCTVATVPFDVSM